MCGVIGLIQASIADAPQKALKALKVMEYRGYDSWGVAWGEFQSDANLSHAVVYRKVGQIGKAKLPVQAVSKQALGHTRWATHGGVTIANAHPHLSADQRFALVHNGVLENFRTLKAQLLSEGYVFRSETDTEVILAIWERSFSKLSHECKCATTLELLELTARHCFAELKGSNAIVVMDYASGFGVAVRSGSPLIVGKSSEGYCVVSDMLALVGLADVYVTLGDKQLAVFNAQQVAFYSLDLATPIEAKWLPLAISHSEVAIDGYAHFMLKEINEADRVIHTILASRSLFSKLREVSLILSDVIYIVGCGTAYHAALFAAHLITAQTDKRAVAFLANEFSAWNQKAENYSVIFISQSGETADILVHAQSLKRRGIAFVSLINREQSSLEAISHLTIPCMAGPEQAVVASKSFVAQLSVLLLLSAVLSNKSTLIASTRKSLRLAAVELTTLTNKLAHDSVFNDLAIQLTKVKSAYVLGRELLYPIALETSLKLKEAAYVHAEGFSAGELKHGVLALIQKGVPVVCLATEEKTFSLDYASSQEVAARNGQVYGFTTRLDVWGDTAVLVKQIGEATPILVAVVGQLLAYTVAIQKNINPDKPRNLAKSVTVR